MSESKQRRRYRKPNKQPQEDKQRPVVLAKRERGDERVSSNRSSSTYVENEVKPIILLKTKSEKSEGRSLKAVESSSSSIEMTIQKTIIVTRSDMVQSPALFDSSPNTTIELATVSGAAEASTSAVSIPQLVEPVPQMTRPSTIISSTGAINLSARKLLMKTNPDFLVVGVIGMQGVGKSTIMNLLANENPNYDYYNKMFVEEDSIFPTKLKPNKCLSRSRTESTHMFVTSDRMLLLDSPPVLCNSYKRDMVTNELDDLRQIITFLSVCHVLIVVQDDYINLSFIRLIQFAELMKPTQDISTPVDDYFPNLLFVRNRAKRQDYLKGQKERMDSMLRSFFKDSQLRQLQSHTAEEQQHKQKAKPIDAVREVNSFYIPQITSDEATPFHSSFADIVAEFRRLVFMTPRSELPTPAGTNELVETNWFDMLSKVVKDTQHFSLKTYEEIHRKHLEASSGSGSSGSNSGNIVNARQEHLNKSV